MSRAVCAAHALPYFALDKILWRPNWVAAPKDDFDEAHRAWIERDRWLIDGYGPWASVEDRLAACNTVILIDLPFSVHLWWATKRQIKSIFGGYSDIPDGCSLWPVTFRLFKMMWRLHRDTRPKLIDLIYRHSEHARIIHIRSAHELNAFTQNPV